MKFTRVESYVHGGQAYTTESGMKYVRLPDAQSNGFLWYKLPGVERASDPWACSRAYQDFWMNRELEFDREHPRSERQPKERVGPLATLIVSAVSGFLLWLAWVTA